MRKETDKENVMKNFKRIACGILAALAICTFAACGKKENQTEDSADTGSKKAEGVSFYAEYKGVKIEMGAEAEAIISKLGEYQSKKEIGDCGGLGAQVKYSYPSVDVYVLESKEDGSVIDQISFKDDVISTPEGVFIGMEVSKAKGILGTPDKESDKSMEYGDGKYALVIGFADGKVNRIDYLS